MRLLFDTPLWLLATPLAAVVVLLRLRSAPRRAGAPESQPVGRRQRRRPWDAAHVAAWLRAAAVLCLVLALAGPRIGVAGRRVDVAFLVDASDSVGAARSQALTYVRDAVAAKPDGDRAALGLFGGDAHLEHGLREEPLLAEPAVVVDRSATDLEQALRLGQGAVGSAHRRRIVLLTDGRQTGGDAVRAAEEAAAAGIAVDVVPLAGAQVADVLVEEVDAPSRVRAGEAYDVTVRMRNTGAAARGILSLLADGARVHREAVTLPSGTTEVTVPRTAESTGSVRYEARLESGGSALTANDVARAAVRVDGPPRVLVVERAGGVAEDLTRALRSTSLALDLLALDGGVLPTLDRLLDYDSVVLVDVPAAVLGEQAMTTLDAFVRDAGHGLVAVGGEESFGMGEYDGTTLEELLPVFARVTDPRKRPPVAEALVVDTSGSMAACHCADENAVGAMPMDPGGVNKTDISKEAVARAVDALESQDIVGVLAFNTQQEWVIPLQHLPEDAVVDEGLARLHPEGNTDVVEAVREAIAGLLDTDARLRHIVLFTDGFTDNADLVEVAEEASAAGVTLSVVATGEGPRELQDTLRRMATAGGGRYYPGRDLSSIPDIIALEMMFAARPIINEGRFLPVVTGTSPATEDLTASPPLLGYLATTPKPTARTLLRIGDQSDPLLATWQAGLGTATAWTSDAAARWSAPWIGWERFAGFWSAVVRDTLPSGDDARGALTATATAEGIRVRLDTVEDLPADVDARVTVTAPDGGRAEVPLRRVALDAFAADLSGSSAAQVTAEGVYAVSARVRVGDEDYLQTTVTATRSYPAEYALGDSDPTLLRRVVEAGGGRLDPQPTSVFDPALLQPGEATRPLWPSLALLAMALAVADVGLRRLRLEREDWGRAKAWVQARLGHRSGRGGADGPGGSAPQRTAEADALFAAKARARARQSVAGPPQDG